MVLAVLQDLPSGKDIMSSDAWVREIVDAIATNFHPEGIILFGSRAAGTATPDSDIDLLVLIDIAKNKMHETYVAMRMLFPSPEWSLDLILMTPQHFEEFLHVPNTMAYTARNHGKLVYG